MNTSNKYSGRKLKKPDMKQAGNFTQIPNAFILNPSIRDPELRLLQYILMYSDHRTITTTNCILYLGKTKPSIIKSFEKLISIGILKIDNENIEVIIPEEMRKFKLGYLDSKENLISEVKKTLPSESEKTLQEGKENLTIEVKKSLLPGKENITTEVKKPNKIPLESTDGDSVTNPIILNNSRVLPAPATSGSAEQTHSNDNTKGKTAIDLDLLECVTHPSARIPSGVPQTLHTPTEVRESEITPKVEVTESHTPKVENECQKIITHPNCQHIFTNNPQWQVYNEKLFKLSNTTIGCEICKYMLKYYDNPNLQRKSEHSQFLKSDEGVFMNYMFYIVKYSQKLEGSNIWQSFVHECGLKNKENLIKNLTL